MSRAESNFNKQTPIAIIGMGALFPDASNFTEFWQNILSGKNSVKGVPEEYWRISDYFDNDPKARDKTYSKVGAFLPKIPFSPVEFGIPPKQVESIATQQLLSLYLAKRTLEDAGFEGDEPKTYNKEKTGVILAAGMGASAFSLASRLDSPYLEKILHSLKVPPQVSEAVMNRYKKGFLEWDESSFPGFLANVVAGRIANRFNFGGTNCVVDAACASSLAAIKMAMRELSFGDCDTVLTGGCNLENSLFSYVSFSKTPALSPTGASRPYDEKADGILLGEGAGMILLKRLADAERDGDRIYAVIKGVGSASDGRSGSIYAPNPKGQHSVLQRAYEEANILPQTVGLIEGHGTGTVAGDACETAALDAFFKIDGQEKIPLGSVKSQIGHTRMAAGVAGVIKAALALQQKILPASINFENGKNSNNPASPFYVITDKTPWISGPYKRSAGVSSFGFGGANFHIVLEEYESDHSSPYRLSKVPHSLVFNADTTSLLHKKLENLTHALKAGQSLEECAAQQQETTTEPDQARLGLVVQNKAQLLEYLKLCLEKLTQAELEHFSLPQGIYFRKRSQKNLKTAALFPGQGSQKPHMGKSLANHFPEVRKALSRADHVAKHLGKKAISKVIFSRAEPNKARTEITSTDNAQPALGAISVGMYRLATHLGLKPHTLIGHSFGELSALWAGNTMTEVDFYKVAFLRGQAMNQRSEEILDSGAMLATNLQANELNQWIHESAKISVANDNADDQLILSGGTPDINRLAEALQEAGRPAVKLKVSAAFHSPFVAHAKDLFAKGLKDIDISSPTKTVISGNTVSPYPKEKSQIKSLLAEQILDPVYFRKTVLKLYESGHRIFVEVGPGKVLTTLVSKVLKNKPHLAVALSANHSINDDIDFRKAILELKVAGLSLELDPYQRPMKPPKKPDKISFELDGNQYISPEKKAEIKKAFRDSPDYSDHFIPEEDFHKPDKEQQKMNPENTEQTVNDKEPILSEKIIKKQKDFLAQQSEHIGIIKGIQENQRDHIDLLKQATELVSKTLENPEQTEANANFQANVKLMQENHKGHMEIYRSYVDGQREMTKALFGGLPMPLQNKEPITLVEDIYKNEASSPAGELQIDHHHSTPSPTPATRTLETPIAKDPEQNPAPKPITASKIDNRNQIKEKLLSIISDKTGYPTDIIEDDMDIESDLGIDSIKRVEIFSELFNNIDQNMQETAKADPEKGSAFMEKLGAARTITQIVDFLEITTREAINSSAATSKGQEKETSDTSKIKVRLLEIIAEKTGYPQDILDEDMDIESDLGIDSIKRVEIFATLAEDLPEEIKLRSAATSANQESQTQVMTDLGNLRTIKDITLFLEKAITNYRPTEHENTPPRAAATKEKNPDIRRYQLTTIKDHVQDIAADWPFEPGANLLLVGRHNLYRSVLDDLENHGFQVRTLILEGKTLTKTDIKDLLTSAFTKESINGVVIIPQSCGLELEDGVKVPQNDLQDLKTVFLLAACLEAKKLKYWLSISQVDGHMGEKHTKNPILGGYIGLTKALSWEWDKVRCLHIDCHPGLSIKQTLDAIRMELSASHELVAVGRSDKHTRVKIDHQETTNVSNQAGLHDGVYLVSGGARGITGACVRGLAKKGVAKFILIGRSPITCPHWVEPNMDTNTIRDALVKTAKQHGTKIIPAKIDSTVNKIQASLEVKQQLDFLAKLGCEVRYVAADITDSINLGRAIRDHADLGKISCVIHGSGALRDNKIENKTLEDLNIVLDTKVLGLKNLLESLDLKTVKEVIIFSSVAGYVGNKGQTDYAAANEILNKYATSLSNQYTNLKTKVLHWGPWQGGMVGDSLLAIYEKLGIDVIPIDSGVQQFVDEVNRYHETQKSSLLITSPQTLGGLNG